MAKRPLTLEVLRRRAGLSQLELAELVGRTQPDISNWERGLEIPEHTVPVLFETLMFRLDRASFEPSELLDVLEPRMLSKSWEDILLGRP
jgi:transcriptional regulator with XRE-family HTH domain